MPNEDDGGRGETRHSPHSVYADPERQPLIPSDADTKANNDKSVTQNVVHTRDEEEENEDGSVEEEDTAKSVLAILSLLLIGKPNRCPRSPENDADDEIGVFISNADTTLVMATYGTIASEFGAFGDASWLTTSFALATCAVQPIVGKLSDIYGRKRVLLVGYVLFAAGSVFA
jgi:hypothetical protein